MAEVSSVVGPKMMIKRKITASSSSITNNRGVGVRATMASTVAKSSVSPQSSSIKSTMIQIALPKAN